MPFVKVNRNQFTADLPIHLMQVGLDESRSYNCTPALRQDSAIWPSLQIQPSQYMQFRIHRFNPNFAISTPNLPFQPQNCSFLGPCVSAQFVVPYFPQLPPASFPSLGAVWYGAKDGAALCLGGQMSKSAALYDATTHTVNHGAA